MIKLDEGNVLLKPSHRKQLMSWLKRSLKMGEKIGNFMLQITLQRSGNSYEVRANVRDSAGSFDCRSRQRDWRTALRELVRSLVMQLHAQRVRMALQ